MLRKPTMIAAVATVATLLSSPRTARAHVNDNLKAGSDIIATTRGVYHRWPHGNEFLQKRQYMPTDTLNVAFGHRRFITTKRNGAKQLNIVGFTAPFSSPGADHIYRVTPRLPPPWKAINKEGSRLVGAPAGACVSSGLTCIHPDDDDAKILLLCNVNGIFKSTDGGKTFRLVCRSQVQ